MNVLTLFFSIACIGLSGMQPSFGSEPKPKIKVLIVTGGHDYFRKPFYAAFDAIPSISYDTIVHPEANKLIGSPEIGRYDVLVFYDMGVAISAEQKAAYVNLLQKGKAFIYLHHSLVSYQDWPEFVRFVGGQYHTRPVVINKDTLHANYRDNELVPVRIEDKKHPVTKGINNFEIRDEIYMDAEILPTVKPLLSTTHPESMKYLGWINQYGNSEVLYIQLGHGDSGLSNPNFRKLLRQAIEWSAERHSPKSRDAR
jgi:uncharacterized protein